MIRIFPIDLQDKIIRNLNAMETVTIESGHLPKISKPKKLVEVLNRFTATITG